MNAHSAAALAPEPLNFGDCLEFENRLRKRLRAHPSPKALVCITAYNEPSTALRASLAGLSAGVSDTGGQALAAGDVAVCLIVDGEDRMHPSTRTLLEELPSEEPEMSMQSAWLTVSVRQIISAVCPS